MFKLNAAARIASATKVESMEAKSFLDIIRTIPNVVFPTELKRELDYAVKKDQPAPKHGSFDIDANSMDLSVVASCLKHGVELTEVHRNPTGNGLTVYFKVKS